MTVLVDTSAFVAALDETDARRTEALSTFARLQSLGRRLVTHEYIVVETMAVLQRRLGMAAIRQFVDDTLPLTEVAWIDRDVHLEARRAVLEANQRLVSLVDWTSFIVMRRLGISTAFAFDPDFAAQGFEVIPAPTA